MNIYKSKKHMIKNQNILYQKMIIIFKIMINKVWSNTLIISNYIKEIKK